MDFQGILYPGLQCCCEEDVEEKSPCGRYVRFRKLLGRGAFKDVYKGFDLVDNVEIAWNQICFDDEKTLKSSCTEAVLLKSLAHRNVMKCYSHWVDDKNQCVILITELFSCGNLRQYMKKLGSMDLQTIKSWGRQILQGLEYLHTQNPRIVHRDLKSDNIFIDASNGEIKLGDFGLSTRIEESPIQIPVGTPEFMAPEYYDEEYDELVDIYAFGMCLLEMATFEYPYSECTNAAQIYKKVSSGIKPMALERVADPEVKEMIHKCLLPAALRPCAVQLLNDSFFVQETPMEIEHSNTEDSVITTADSCSTASVLIDDVSHVHSDSGLGAASSIARNGFVWTEDQYPGRRQSCFIDDSILSDISTLYNSMSVSRSANFEDKLGSTCCASSSISDASMNSGITFNSLLGAL